MSVSMESIAAKLQGDPAAAALLLQLFGGEAAVQQQPKAAEEYQWQPIPKEWETGWQIIRELNSRDFDREAVVTTAAVDPKGQRPGHPEGVVATWEDGSAVTFGDLAFVVPEGAVNSEGVKVNDYPNVWSLTWPEAKGALTWLRQQPKKAKPSSGGQRRGGGKAAGDNGGGESEALKAVMAALAAIQHEVAELRGEAPKEVPAKPEPAIGHRKAAGREPAKPVSEVRDSRLSTQEVTPLEPGQLVAWQGQFYELTLQANGRIGMQKLV